MKTLNRFLFLVIIISLVLSACGSGEVYYDPQAYAGNPTSPGEISAAYAAGPQASTVNIYYTVQLLGLKPIREIGSAGIGYIIEAVQSPDSVTEALLVIPASATMAISDGPWIGILDIVAVVMIGTSLFYLCTNSVGLVDQAIATFDLEGYREVWNLSIVSAAAVENIFASHSNWNHNPNIAGSQARKNITAFLAAMATYLTGNGQDPRSKCGVTRDATGAVIRAAIWVADSSKEAGGYLMWFFHNIPGTPMKGPWGGSYEITSENFDLDRNAQFERDRGWTWTAGVDCNSIGVPTFLQAAQP